MSKQEISLNQDGKLQVGWGESDNLVKHGGLHGGCAAAAPPLNRVQVSMTPVGTVCHLFASCLLSLVYQGCVARENIDELKH